MIRRFRWVVLLWVARRAWLLLERRWASRSAR